jgi:dTDP-L-rhamnose 4-epimerase
VSGRRVLVTGGAGFVGSHLVDALLARGHQVRILDNLDPQVHGPDRRKPAWVPADAEFIQGDMRSADDVRGAVRGMQVVYHLAAAVGVGQSMYQIADYTDVNTLGTAHLLQALVDDRGGVEKLVVASSMSIYGEGRYARPDGGEPAAVLRTPDRLRAHQWEPCDADGTVLSPVPTDEGKPLDPTSIYALTKADQEKMVLMVGAAYGIPSVALRFFNIYGPRQALSNPYTGVAAIFSSRLLNGQPPLVFEDGGQKRDFVSVHDIVQALLLSAQEEAAVGKAFNVGSGRPVSVLEVARTLSGVLGTELEAQVVGKYRVGDIRHCFGDISLAREVLGYEPRVTFEQGMQELVAWLQEQDRPEDHVETHAAELAARGLTL